MTKIHIYSDAQLYVSGVSFLRTLHIIVNNMNRDNKKYFGYDLISYMNNFIMNFSLSYKENDNNKKLHYATDSFNNLDKLEIQLNILKDINVISFKQFTHLFKEIGMFKINTNGWIKSLENKINC